MMETKEVEDLNSVAIVEEILRSTSNIIQNVEDSCQCLPSVWDRSWRGTTPHGCACSSVSGGAQTGGEHLPWLCLQQCEYTSSKSVPRLQT